MERTKAIFDTIDRLETEMVEFTRGMLKVPAIAPESGGAGELDKAEWIVNKVSGWGFDRIERYDAPDDRVPSGRRPNVLLRLKGSMPELPSLWTFVHLDVVPPGDMSKWSSDPFSLRIEGEKLIARGVEDNGQDLVAALFAAKALMMNGLHPEMDVNIFLVADEEVGSEKGIVHVTREHPELFRKDDLFIVPDAGVADGSMIEVSEKSIAWLKVRTIGKEVHGSVPNKGINANLAAMRFMVAMNDELEKRYPAEDPLYDHVRSSFSPTKREANVLNINTIPGEDVSYMDSRILPCYDPDEVFEHIKKRAKDFEKEHGVTIEVSKVQFARSAPPTPADHPVVSILGSAIEEVYGVKASPMGIGGGTCAAFLRREGYPAVVWGKLEDTAHQPNEYALVQNYIGDAKVFASVFMHRAGAGRPT